MPVSALASLRSRRFPFTAWPWRSVAYLVTTVPVATLVGIPLLILGFPWAVLLRRLSTGDAGPLDSLLLLIVGAGLIGGLGPIVAAPVAVMERLRLKIIDDRVTLPGRVDFTGATAGRLRHRFTGPVGWREFAYAVVLVTAVPVLYGALAVALLLIVVCAAGPVLVVDGPISLGVVTISTTGEAVPWSVAGVAALLAVPYLFALVAGAHGAAARALLMTAPDATLRAELVEVSRSRARLVDAFEAERRRIERDLHDGAQQKLVGLTLQLGLARLDLPPATPAATAVATAHDQAKELMAELRELIHGIRPQVLTELGLPAALRELAGRAPVPVTVRADLPRRPPDHLEAAGYFVVAEALTNVAKHSGASRAAVAVSVHDGLLVVEVTDDGRGGADPARGTGLTGLADRVAVMDGRMLLSSPAGGPTLLRVELPWS